MRDSGYEVDASQVLVTNGGKQARLQGLRDAARPGRRGPAARAVLDDLPRGDRGSPAASRSTSRPTSRPATSRPSSSSRPRAPSAPRCSCSCSPSNPTGAVYPPEQVEAIGRWALEHGLWVVTDEIYEHLVYGDAEFASMPVVVPELADRCLVVNGVAKTYAMTGWRVGWMIGPADVVKAATNLQSHATSNVSNVAQVAALAAVSRRPVRRRRDARRRSTAGASRSCRMLNEIHGVECPTPHGAFYCYPSVKGAARQGDPRPAPADVGRAGRAHPRRGRGRGRPGRGVRHAGLPPAVLRARRRRPGRGRRPDPEAARPRSASRRSDRLVERCWLRRGWCRLRSRRRTSHASSAATMARPASRPAAISRGVLEKSRRSWRPTDSVGNADDLLARRPRRRHGRPRCEPRDREALQQDVDGGHRACGHAVELPGDVERPTPGWHRGQAAR